MADQEYNEEQIERLISAMGQSSDAFEKFTTELAKDAAKTSRSFGDVSDSASQTADVLSDLAKAAKAEEKAEEERLTNEKNAWNQATQAFTNLGQAVNSTTPRFTDYTSTIQSASDAAASLASNFGLLGEVVGKTVQILGAVTGAYITQFQEQLDFSDQMRKMGSMTIDLGDSTTNTSDSMTDLARDAGYTSKKLAELGGIMAGQGPAIAMFGQGMSDGTGKFLKYIKLTDEEMSSMRRLGYTMTEVNEIQMQYIELQKAGNINTALRGKSELALKKESLKYLASLSQISELTGKTAEAQMKDQTLAAQDYRNKINNLNEQTKAAKAIAEANRLKEKLNDTSLTTQERINLTNQEAQKREYAERISQDIKNREKIVGMISRYTDAATGVMFQTQMISGAIDSTSTAITLAGVNAGDLYAKTRGLSEEEADKVGKEFLQQFLMGQRRNLNAMATSISLSGDQAESLGKMFALTDEQTALATRLLSEGDMEKYLEVMDKSIAKTEKTAKKGADAATDAAAKLQEWTRYLSTSADRILDEFNPAVLIATTAVTLLSAAAFAASVALGKIGALAGLAGSPGTKAGPGLISRTLARPGVKTGVVAGVVATGLAINDGIGEQVETDRLRGKGVITEEDADRRNKITKTETVTESVGAIGGAVAGGWGGAQAGAMLGAFGGPIGIAIGGTLGGLIGAGLGAWAGGSAGEELGETIGGNVFATLDDEVAKASLDLAKSGGLYQKKGMFRDSDVDLDKVSQAREKGELTQNMLKAMLEDNDMSDENTTAISTILADMVEKEEGLDTKELEKATDDNTQALIDASEVLSNIVADPATIIQKPKKTTAPVVSGGKTDGTTTQSDGIMPPAVSVAPTDSTDSTDSTPAVSVAPTDSTTDSTDSDTTVVEVDKALDSGGTLATGEIGLVGELGPELVQGPADVTSREETALDLDYIKSLMNTIDKMQGGDKANDDIKGQVQLTQDTVNETTELMNKAFEAAGLKSPAPGVSASDQMAQLEELTSPAALDTSGAWDFDLDDMSSPTVDIAPKEVPKPEETSQGSPQLAGDLDKPDAKSDENLKLLADLGMMLGRLDSRMEEQNSLTEKIVQYSSV